MERTFRDPVRRDPQAMRLGRVGQGGEHRVGRDQGQGQCLAAQGDELTAVAVGDTAALAWACLALGRGWEAKMSWVYRIGRGPRVGGDRGRRDRLPLVFGV